MFRSNNNLALAVFGAAMVLTAGTRTARPAVAEVPAATAEKRLNPDLLNLPPSTWVKIKPNRNPEGRSFSGICWGNGLIYYFGGYHGSYTCNDVELYDAAVNTWTQATEPEDWRDCDAWKYLTPAQAKLAKDNARGTNYPGILTPKGRPLTCHTYQQHVWFPEEQAFYNILVRIGLWAFDPAKREWHEVTKRLPEIKDLSGCGLYYDPVLKTVFAVTAGGDASGAYVFDAGKRTWVLRCKLPSADWSEVHAAYDSTRKVHVVHAQRKLNVLGVQGSPRWGGPVDGLFAFRLKK